MLRQAVESNLDVIHDRLPPVIRPARRRMRTVVSWTARVALPALAIVGGTGLARQAPPPSSQMRLAQSGADAQQAARSAVGGSIAATGKPFSPEVLGLAVRRIVIDAGHGGEQGGATSPAGLAEKAITLDIARRLRVLMIEQGFDTVMTRDGDATMSLQQRAAIANHGRADAFVSIHLNSFDAPSVNGIETYYLGPGDGKDMDAIAERENQGSGYSMADLRVLLDRIFADARRDESKRFAAAVQQALVQQMRTDGVTLADRGVKSAPFVVLVATEMPAILAEVSCLSNPEEAARLGTPGYRQRIASALASGVAAFARQQTSVS